MYIFESNIYASAGNYLKSSNCIAWSFPGTDETGIEEVPFDYSELVINDTEIWIGKVFICDAPKVRNYNSLVEAVVKSRYSNDAQIAIILNNRKDELQYMNEWRDFAKLVAKKLLHMK